MGWDKKRQNRHRSKSSVGLFVIYADCSACICRKRIDPGGLFSYPLYRLSSILHDLPCLLFSTTRQLQNSSSLFLKYTLFAIIKITFQNTVGNNVAVIPIISAPSAPKTAYTMLKTIFHTYKAVSFAGADLLYLTNCDRTTKQKIPMPTDMMPAPTISTGCAASDDNAK